MSNLDTHINSNYLVTLLVNLLTKLGLNLSKKSTNKLKKSHTEEERHFPKTMTTTANDI
jgi:hypothetical protein